MSIVFKPGSFSPKALDFLKNSTARLCILHGSVRSGKTVNCTVRWLAYMANGPPGKLVLLGKSKGSIHRNVLDDMLDIVGSANYRWIDRQRGVLTVYGRQVHVIGASTREAEERLRGATFAGAYCDEANTYPKEVWYQLLARLSVKGAQLFANCNPETPHHWFYKGPLTSPDIEDRQVWHFTMDDNPNLEPEYKEALINEYKGSPIFYKRFVLGEWVVAEGSIYQVFSDNETEFDGAVWCKKERAVTVKGKQMYLAHINIGVDWGQNKSAHAFVAAGITDDYAHLIILRAKRHLAKGTTPNDVFDWFCEFAEGIERDFGKLRAVYCDGTEQLMINMLKQNTVYPVRNALKHPINDRIRITVALMAMRRLQFLQGGDWECLKDFFRNARYKDNAEKDTRLDDGTYDVDTGDAFEYAMENHMRYLADMETGHGIFSEDDYGGEGHV